MVMTDVRTYVRAHSFFMLFPEHKKEKKGNVISVSSVTRLDHLVSTLMALSLCAIDRVTCFGHVVDEPPTAHFDRLSEIYRFGTRQRSRTVGISISCSTVFF